MPSYSIHISFFKLKSKFLVEPYLESNFEFNCKKKRIEPPFISLYPNLEIFTE